ncbi:MAG TPA: UDP-3-O-(3-hydroxymyristoyl)glucosamine N-acyltransferase [Candidatus Acidoferrales bacterium]|nr:UDP-3-O-(3-hydroxymyristoyl)glucosamine N-acyltransferase [Candidatus Acidoferrales bacterium]
MNHTAAELAQYLGAKLRGDARTIISGVASPERARRTDLIYLASARHAGRAGASAALCMVASPDLHVPGKTILEVANPKLAFVKAAALLVARPATSVSIHSTAIIAPDANLAADVTIGPYVVIEDGVAIGPGTSLGAFCFLGRGAAVGENCCLHPRVTLYAGARLGRRVEVHSGAVIGSDGFGYVFGDGRYWKFPQIGTVEIGDDVEIGANTTIDRGSLETTRIDKGVKIDNLVQIAHNVRIGEHSILAAQTGVSGSSTLGTGVITGGQVGIADHCRLEDGAVAGAQAGIPSRKTIRHGQTVWGTPARPLEKFKQQYAWFARLPALAQRVRTLEKSEQEG